MPLINETCLSYENRGNGLEDITMKKVRNFSKFRTNLPITEGEGIFSGLTSLISTGAKFIKANSDVIKTATSAGANVASAGKNIADAVNSTRKVNAEIEQLKKIKDYRARMKNMKALSKAHPSEEPSSLQKNIPKVSEAIRESPASVKHFTSSAGASDKNLSQEQQKAIESLAKNISKKKGFNRSVGKGLRIY